MSSAADPAHVAAAFVAAQEALLTEIERGVGSSRGAGAVERAAARCAQAFEAFRELYEAGAALPVDTVARARRLSVLLSTRAQLRSGAVAGDIARTRAARRVLESTGSGDSPLGRSCDMAG
ncbi:hypothetical protein [Engelhardtia mirabilis]|uniref:Uncharacterized protein n=1 Tax=Engelhardtia mirabilis TaxID=2528011 RepID=A0A518BSQ9_9BACT|nr:hypothetical protein Pla133_51330 [Planctomycetes bacterium Pla133]QDV04335.1 hypothetical protein Pla86_51300 [Planctomycetes bacterium Pla86]